MHIRRKKCYLCYVVLLIFLIILFKKNIVIAGQTVDNDIQAVSSNATGDISASSTLGVSNILKYILSISPAGLYSTINIYKYFLERKYEIVSINIEFICKDITHDNKYPTFYCEKIIVGENEIDKRRVENPYYLDVMLIIKTSNTRDRISNIVIKGIEFEMGGYKLQYKGEGRSLLGYKKCRVDKQSGVCLLLFKYPSIKTENGLSMINPVPHFQNPKNVRLNFKWASNANIFSIFGFLIPKTVNAEFEKKDNQNSSTFIGIKSVRIY